MSYEGFTQYLCEKGHYWMVDCYYDNGPQKCPTCGDKPVWRNMVDETNGMYDTDELGQQIGERIDGFVELEQDEYVESMCPLCGNVHVDICTYKIPEKRNNALD